MLSPGRLSFLARTPLRCSTDWSRIQFCTVGSEPCEYKWANFSSEPCLRFCSANWLLWGHREPAANTQETAVLKLVCIVTNHFSLFLWKIAVCWVCLEKEFSIFWFMDPKKRSSESVQHSYLQTLHTNLLFLNPFEAIEKTKDIHRLQVRNDWLKTKGGIHFFGSRFFFLHFSAHKFSHSLSGASNTESRTANRWNFACHPDQTLSKTFRFAGLKEKKNLSEMRSFNANLG